MDFYGFYTGKVFDAYRYLGGHLTEAGAVFRTFAPAAEAISVIGDFNGWQETPMERVYDGNFWSCEIPGAGRGFAINIGSGGGTESAWTTATPTASPWSCGPTTPPSSGSCPGRGPRTGAGGGVPLEGRTAR